MPPTGYGLDWNIPCRTLYTKDETCVLGCKNVGSVLLYEKYKQ